MDADHRATRLLQRFRSGDPEAGRELLPLIYEQLHRLAERQMRRQGQEHTLQPTALLNEAWVRIAKSGAHAKDRAHFLQLAAQTMRTVLVDHARRRRAGKRGGERLRVTLNEGSAEAIPAFEALDYLDLDEALVGLQELDQQLTRIVELRFFAGLTIEETAALMEVSDRTVERGWRTARAWLAQRLGA